MNGIPGVTLRGVDTLPVEVEVEIAGGLFGIYMVIAFSIWGESLQSAQGIFFVIEGSDKGYLGAVKILYEK